MVLTHGSDIALSCFYSTIAAQQQTRTNEERVEVKARQAVSDESVPDGWMRNAPEREPCWQETIRRSPIGMIRIFSPADGV